MTPLTAAYDNRRGHVLHGDALTGAHFAAVSAEQEGFGIASGGKPVRPLKMGRLRRLALFQAREIAARQKGEAAH